MLGSVYTFESASGEAVPNVGLVSELAARAIEVGINEHPGIRYQELTDPTNPKPVFAVFFPDSIQKGFFEDLFGRALEVCGLRVNIVHALKKGKPEQAISADVANVA